jgi:hypothetical protein
MPPGRGRLTRLHNDCMEAGTFSAFLVASTRAFVSAVTAKYTVDLARNGAMLAGEDLPINCLDRQTLGAGKNRIASWVAPGWWV